ncbi:MAG: 50S ribosomal protein L10 [Calditrichaeota bacterium]|nr:50S ribosomal protein L10 [Calditrichota bacterium]MCB0270133.1 50S ribosomal protein L10 [Calditrichota bacterium]
MPTPQKETIVQDMADKFGRASSFIMTDFTGVDANTIVEIRKKFFESDIDYRVVKNTLAKISLEKSGIEGLEDYLKGVNAYAISYDDPTLPIKVMEGFKKQLGDKMPIKAAYFEGQVIESSRVTSLSSLPSKQELIGKFAGMIISPMGKLASTLNANMQNVVGVLNALKEKKEN